MNALDRADQTLARAQARRAGIVTPDSATSPMDQTSTVQIPRALVQAVDPRAADPEATVVIPVVSADLGTDSLATDSLRPDAQSSFGPARRPVRPRR